MLVKYHLMNANLPFREKVSQSVDNSSVSSMGFAFKVHSNLLYLGTVVWRVPVTRNLPELRNTMASTHAIPKCLIHIFYRFFQK